MTREATESQFVSNMFLFELENPHDVPISNELHAFLAGSQFPWELLGKSLTHFVEACVASVPQKDRLSGKIDPRAYLENEQNIVISKDAVVEAGAFISGPTFIGPHAVIRHGAYVRGSVYVSSHAVVGHTTECKGCILLPHAKAAHFNYVGDSILGYDCNLGAGTKLANLKINNTNINVAVDGKKIDTGLRKFGAILGNRAQTGCNAVTNPGTIMLPNSVLLPNQTSHGIIKNVTENR